MIPNIRIEKISCKELQECLDIGDPMVLIDTLTLDHFERAHLPKAHSACVFDITFLEQVTRLAPSKTTPIVLYGADLHTMDAATAANKLVRAGYQRISILEGGLRKWRENAYPLRGLEPDVDDQDETVLDIADGRYDIDIVDSIIEWTGRNPNSRHHGTVRLAKGEIVVKANQMTGSFKIAMGSIENVNLQGDPLKGVLETHLASDDFFFVERFPYAEFTLDSAVPIASTSLSEPNFRMKGDLTLCGIQADIAFMSTVNKLPDNRLAAEAHFDIDRTRWNIIYGSNRFFSHLGKHLVYDLISIQMKMITT